MKKYIYYTFLFLIPALFATSCSLEEKLYDKLPVDKLVTEKDIADLVEGTYGELNDPAAFKLWGSIMMMSLSADDFTSTAANQSEFANFGMKEYGAVDTYHFWNSMYRIIRQCNEIMKKLEDVPEKTGLSTRLSGEAHFLRGFAYYYLVRLYGGVPLRLDVVNYASDFYLPRTPAADIYTQIFEDLEIANSKLPLKSAIPASETGRATKGAAQAMLASASLTFANYIDVENIQNKNSAEYYQAAIDWYDSIIASNQYALIEKYEELYKVETQGNTSEIIFAVQFASDDTKTGQAAAGSEFAFRFLPENMFGVTGQVSNDRSGNNTIFVQPYFYYEYYGDANYSLGEGDMDYRLEVSFFTRWVNIRNGRQIFTFPVKRPEGVPQGQRATKPQCYLAKYVDGEAKDNRNHGNDFIISRMSEIYLIKAEAINELNGPTQQAFETFNQLRIRARKAGGGVARTLPLDLTSATAGDKDAFRLAVLKERGLEFVGEGLRWFDLVRMPAPSGSGKATMFDYRFAELGDNTKYQRRSPSYSEANDEWTPTLTSIWAGIRNICEYAGEPNKFRLFPIPKSEIDNNPSISYQDQNPGW